MEKNITPRIVKTPWNIDLSKFIKNAKKELIIGVPFFDGAIIRQILEEMGSEVEAKFILGFSQRSLEDGGSDPKVLRILIEKVGDKIQAKQIKNFHAKILISDINEAIVTSGNLTNRGLSKNIEFGVKIKGVCAKDLHDQVMTYWKNKKATVLDKKWLMERESILQKLERKKKRRHGKEEKGGVGGFSIQPSRGWVHPGTKWAILFSDKHNHSEELLSKESDIWTVDAIDEKYEDSFSTAYIYVPESMRFLYKAKIESTYRIETEEGAKTNLKLTNFKTLVSPVDFKVFTKALDGEKIGSQTAIQSSIYVFDPNLPTVKSKSGWEIVKEKYRSSKEVEERLRRGNISDDYRRVLFRLKRYWEIRGK